MATTRRSPARTSPGAGCPGRGLAEASWPGSAAPGCGPSQVPIRAGRPPPRPVGRGDPATACTSSPTWGYEVCLRPGTHYPDRPALRRQHPRPRHGSSAATTSARSPLRPQPRRAGTASSQAAPSTSGDEGPRGRRRILAPGPRPLRSYGLDDRTRVRWATCSFFGALLGDEAPVARLAGPPHPAAPDWAALEAQLAACEARPGLAPTGRLATGLRAPTAATRSYRSTTWRPSATPLLGGSSPPRARARRRAPPEERLLAGPRLGQSSRIARALTGVLSRSTPRFGPRSAPLSPGGPRCWQAVADDWDRALSCSLNRVPAAVAFRHDGRGIHYYTASCSGSRRTDSTEPLCGAVATTTFGRPVALRPSPAVGFFAFGLERGVQLRLATARVVRRRRGGRNVSDDVPVRGAWPRACCTTAPSTCSTAIIPSAGRLLVRRPHGGPAGRRGAAAARRDPELIASARAHAGITGLDLVSEAAARPGAPSPVDVVIEDLQFGRADLVVRRARHLADVATMEGPRRGAADIRHDHGRVLRGRHRSLNLTRPLRPLGVRRLPDRGLAPAPPRGRQRPATADIIDGPSTSTGTTLDANGLKQIEGGRACAPRRAWWPPPTL